MQISDTVRSFIGIASACLGAFVFHQIGFPVAPLTGSALAVSIASLLGARVPLPLPVRNLILCLLGINIGTAVTPEMLRSAINWPLSIAVLAAALVLAMSVSRITLSRWFGYDRRTATLAAAPGHLSYVLSIAADARLDVPMVAISQSIRVLFLTLCVPALVAGLFGATGRTILPATLMPVLPMALLVGAAVVAGLVLNRLRLPAAFLLAGMVVSIFGHATDVTPGRLPDFIVAGSLMGMGALIGSRFVGVQWAELRRAVVAGLWITCVNIAVTLLAVAVVAFGLGVSWPQGIVAFAPGGVEAMAAIGIALGMDPAFVAAHHLARLLLLTVLVPFMTRQTSGPTS